jgi:hypothetical protein
MITKVCEVCGKEFSVKPYRAKTARFCSFACGGKWHMTHRVMRGPDMRGNTYRKGLRPTNAFTSERVRGSNNPRWVQGETFVCEHCGQSFTRKPWLVRQNGTPRFCSSKCFRASGTFRGERSPTWVGGPKTYRGRGWRKARLLAVERDKGTCQRCGKVLGDSIPVHHKRPFREFATAEEANALDNLICLCQSCHMKRERP